MSAPELVAGYVVAGKYTIRSLLRQGGATATYRAVAAKNREVALKIYDPNILSFPDVLKALAQHQALGGKVPADQIVGIADSGTDANSGAPFTVTDFQSMPSLAQLVDRGPLSAADTVTLVRNLARAVELLHSHGVVSLSLHPHNVFVIPGAPYQVRLADFAAGMVRTVLPVPEKAGRWMPWLAPEQIKGQVPPAPAVDIFAVGLIAFFALTGKTYWRSSQAKVPDTAALRREILGERMPASVRAGEFSITLNPAVDTVLARALAFRPGDRYATPREFATGLEAALTGRSVAEVDAARSAKANVGSATVKAGEAAPAANRAPSSGDGAPSTRMAAPPPRKMPLRSTMVGMGNAPAAPPSGSAATAAGPRPPMSTMLGIGDVGDDELTTVSPARANPHAVAPAKNAPAMPAAIGAPPANASPPAMPAAPAKPSPPAMLAAPAKPSPPAMTATPAKPAAPAMTATPAKPAAPAMTPAKPAAPAMTEALAKPAAPAMTEALAKPAAPAMTEAPAKPATPAMATPPAMPTPLAKPATPATTKAMPAEAPIFVPPSTATQRGGPPPLPMAPPPAQLEAALAQFEAASDRLLGSASPESSMASTAVVQAPPASRTAEHGDAGGERVETGVAVVGTDFADTPRKSRLRWVASACGLLVLTGGVAWALSGRNTAGPSGHAASDTKATTAIATAAVATAATADLPSPVEHPAAAAHEQAVNEVHPAAEEPRTGAALEPAPAAPPPPSVQEPEATEPARAAPPPVAEPALPIVHHTPTQPATASGASAPIAISTPRTGTATPRTQPPQKPCGKFLKRCK